VSLEKKSERTRARIYQVAMALFTERPYAAVSVSDICAAANVSRATFFLYFPAKSSLIGEVSQHMGMAWELLAAELVDTPSSPASGAWRTSCSTPPLIPRSSRRC
jgi:AcrR family transcriptional regulator